MNFTLIIAIIAFVHIPMIAIGFVFNDENYWIGLDISSMVIWALLGIRLLQLSRKK